MREYTNNILTSIKQAMNEPKQSKYVKKVMGSVNKHVKGKRSFKIPEYETPPFEEHTKQSTNIFDLIENCDEVLEKKVEQLSETLTVDSGVITSKEETVEKSHTKKLTFSPENNQVFEIEVKKRQPRHNNEMPQKVIAHISTTPEPKHVNYVYNSTPAQKAEELTRKILKSANLIKNYYGRPEYVMDLSAVENTFVRSPSCRSVDSKFIVNLFESRQSKRWGRVGVCIPKVESTTQSLIDQESQVGQNSEPESHKTICSEPGSEPQLDDNEMFQKLKKERDMECVKMVQASNVLKVIRKSSHRDWSDELLAEKILLETDERYTLLVNKIRDLGYVEVKVPKVDHKATVTFSGFEFFLQPQEVTKPSKYSEFFIVTLSHGTELLMSKVMSSKNDNIIVDEKFTFTNVNSDFNIVVKIFTIKLKTSRRTMCSILRKKTKNLCPMSKIYYENVNTYEMKESSVLKPSFHCCGEFTLTKDNIRNSHFKLTKLPSDSKLQADVNYSFHIDSLKINSNLSGFLTLALPNEQNEVLFWERKWCVLNGIDLSIYNYPSDEDFGYPIYSINLEYCLTTHLTNFSNCSRRKTFLLKAGRPRATFDIDTVTLTNNGNFDVEDYFFAADSQKDFELWTNELESIVHCLQDWRQLLFLEDYH